VLAELRLKRVLGNKRKRRSMAGCNTKQYGHIWNNNKRKQFLETKPHKGHACSRKSHSRKAPLLAEAGTALAVAMDAVALVSGCACPCNFASSFLRIILLFLPPSFPQTPTQARTTTISTGRNAEEDDRRQGAYEYESGERQRDLPKLRPSITSSKPKTCASIFGLRRTLLLGGGGGCRGIAAVGCHAGRRRRRRSGEVGACERGDELAAGEKACGQARAPGSVAVCLWRE
jgi:hypothetical protein